MTVRTSSLWTGPMTGAIHTLYTTPADKLTIVKWFSVTHVGNVSTSRLRVKLGSTVLGYLFWNALASNVPQRVDVWCVLPAGWSLEALTDAGTPANVLWLVSGTELQL